MVTQLAYEPALLFIDSKKYLYGTDFNLGAWGSFDPIGYTLLVLKPVLMFTNLGFVALLQHVLGLGMAVALRYILMLRRGVVRWLAALAVAPVLLDAYQLNAEQTIMPDVLFEALVVTGIVLLCCGTRGPRWPSSSSPASHSARRRRSARSGRRSSCRPCSTWWRRPGTGVTRLLHGAVLIVCFALPVVGYMGYSKVVLHYGFEMSNMGVAYLCRAGGARRRLRHAEAARRRAAVVPHPGAGAQVRRGRGFVENNPRSPRVVYGVDVRHGVADYNLPQQKRFAYAVIKQQPMRVVGDITRDSIKIFALTRNTVEGDTPIKRWQFQNVYPTFPPGIDVEGPEQRHQPVRRRRGRR